MYTIFEIKNRKFIINQINQIIWIDYQKNKQPGDKVVSDKVLVHEDEFGQSLNDVRVVAEVVKHSKGKKIIIFKYKAKKRYKKKQGHRQPYTQIKITGVERTNS